MNYWISQIINFRANHAGIPDGLEAYAVADALLDSWDDFSAVEDVAKNGASDADREAIAEIISRYNLECTVDEAVEALVRECQARVEQAAEEEEEEEEDTAA